MTSKHIKFDRGNLELLLKSKTQLLEDYEQELHHTRAEIMSALGGAPEQLFPVLLEPILSNLKDEDQTKEFAKLLVLLKRISLKMDVCKKEVSVVQSLLDDKNPIMIAAVNFDDMEVFHDQSGDS